MPLRGIANEPSVRSCERGEKPDDEAACDVHGESAPGKCFAKAASKPCRKAEACNAAEAAADRDPQIKGHGVWGT